MRLLVSRMFQRTILASSSLNTPATRSLSYCGSAPSGKKCAMHLGLDGGRRRSGVPAWRGSNRPRADPSRPRPRISFSSAALSTTTRSRGSFAAFSASLMIASITGWKCRWPNITAPSMISSVSSLASDSTISTASAVPATTRSSWLSAISSICGLSTYSLLMKPTRAAPIGPMNGAPDSVSAAEDATSARMSGSFSRSCDSVVTITCVSQRQPSANSGRIGRSIRRETSVSFSVGRPSRLK